MRRSASHQRLVPPGWFPLMAQLVLSGILVGAFAVGTVVIASTRAPGLLALLAAGLAAAGAGLLAAFPLQRGFYLLDLALARLAAGLPVETLPRRTWPLTHLFAQVRVLNEQTAERAEGERQTAEYREQLLRQVSETAAQEERNRLARDLHDSIKQQIFGMTVSAAAARARWETDPAGARAAIDDIARSTQEAQVEMQALLQQLRPAPLEKVGLVEALRVQCEALGYRSGARVSVELGELPDDDRLPPGAQETVFRIAQEALANVARHARATTVELRLCQEGEALLLEVRDDGQGFDPLAGTRGGMGLANVRERAHALRGTVALQSAPGHGTALRVAIPLDDPVRAARQRERDAERETLLEKANQALGFSMNALRLAAILILLGAPFVAVALSIAVAFGGLLRAHLLRARVTLIAGRTSAEALRLRYEELDVLPVLLILCGLAVWYLPVAVDNIWPAERAAGIALLLWLLCDVFTVVALVGWYRATSRYYRQLVLPDLRRKMYQRLRSAINGFWIWIAALLLVVVFGHFHPGMPPRSARQWSEDATIALLVIAPLVTVFEYLQTLPWNRRLVRAEAAHDAHDATDG